MSRNREYHLPHSGLFEESAARMELKKAGGGGGALRKAVFTRSVMESPAWTDSTAAIPLVVGEDNSGQPVVIDLATAPHILISGSTGTGKSVCMNTFVASLLFRFSPDELKLIMIDPKVVEFDIYRKLPHLAAPVINDCWDAARLLHQTVDELELRYALLARNCAKNIREFNGKAGNQPKMPYLVVIIDELGDLIMDDARRDVVENAIVSIAQKGRAAGIHLIVATQRPSTNIITGIIRANFPTRICFQVRSSDDSKTVLDAAGAEKLLGMGDMLMMQPFSSDLKRMQGAYIPDGDVERIVKFVENEASQEIYDAAAQFLREGGDELFRRALGVVALERKLSVSFLQRRLGIGYNRATAIEAALRKLLMP